MHFLLYDNSHSLLYEIENMFLLNGIEYKPLISLILEDMYIFMTFIFDFYMNFNLMLIIFYFTELLLFQ